MKYCGVGKERIFKHVRDGKILIWNSETTPWTKVYITEEEYLELEKDCKC